MRIAQLVNNLEFGGAERLLSDLSLQLKFRGHSVDVICLRGEGPLAGPLKAAGVAVTSLSKSEGFSVDVLGRLAGILKDRRIEVIHTHNPLVHHYGVLGGRWARVPVVVNTLHGFGNLDDSRKTRMIFDASCLFSTRVVCVCHALDRHLRKVTTAAGKRSVVIPNGIPVERFTSIEHPASGPDMVFGAVGRLAPVKDHRTLLHAFALLSRRHASARLEILGDGPLRAQLEDLAAQLGLADRIRLVAPVLDVAVFLARVNVFAMSSLTEGLPLTLLEAMAAGVPVVATSVGAIPEIVAGAGCGWLAPPGDPAALAASMEAALASAARPSMGMRGRDYALRFHSLQAMTDGYERLFEGLLCRNEAAFSITPAPADLE